MSLREQAIDMGRDKGRVLVIDDSLMIQRLVEARLRSEFDVTAAATGMAGIEQARVQQPDVILLDVDMPGISGYETCRLLKSDASVSHIPVIFLTAQSRTEDKVRGLDLGAIDYVPKPFDPIELRARVRSAYKIKGLLEMLATEAKMDGLTKLHNRLFFDARLREELERADRYGGQACLVMLDVDKFKSLNDTFGHSFGDTVLVEVAETLRSIARKSDVLARYGGEEFVVILPEQDLYRGGLAAERMRSAVEALRMSHNEQRAPVTASFGVASTSEIGFGSPQALIDAADKALYAAKHGGRNRVCLWNGGDCVPASVSSGVL